MRRAKSEYSIQTVANALRTLEAFDGEADLGVSELSRKLELHKNNVFRLLATLEENGYVEQIEKTERYRLGASCQRIGRAFRESHPIPNEAPLFVGQLAEVLGETAHIAVRSGDRVRHLHGACGTGEICAADRIGREAPCHSTALGKVLLGCAPIPVLERFDRTVLARTQLERFTPQTISDREKFIEHLRGVAAQGFAVDLEEWQPQLRCVAVPVYDGENGVAAALSVSAPAFRLDLEQIERRVVPELQAVAQQISRAIGAPE